jgi:hypothetical protein
MKLRTIGRRLVAATLLAAMPYATVNAVTSSAPAAPDQHLVNLKTKGAAEIDRRVTNLQAALVKLADSKTITAADRDALVASVNAELAGLTTLKTKLAADSTIAAARADVVQIVTDYRVYTLMLPKARLLATSDRIQAAQANLGRFQELANTKIAAAKSAGKDVSAVEASAKLMGDKLAKAQTDVAGLNAKLLALQPADYNANHAALDPYRLSLTDARDNLKSARDQAHAVVDGLKALQ